MTTEIRYEPTIKAKARDGVYLACKEAFEAGLSVADIIEAASFAAEDDARETLEMRLRQLRKEVGK